MLKSTRNSTGNMLSASAPSTSLERICDPRRLPRRSMYSFTPVRNSMKPSITVSRKTSVDRPQKTKVCSRLAGSMVLKENDPCHTTTVSNSRNTTSPSPAMMRRLMGLIELSREGAGGFWQRRVPRRRQRFRLLRSQRPHGVSGRGHARGNHGGGQGADAERPRGNSQRHGVPERDLIQLVRDQPA